MSSAGVLLCSPRGQLLLCRRTADGYWATPGGRIERGETPRQAAKRELLEETGIPEIWDMRVLMVSESFTLFGASLPDLVAPALDHEHDAYTWVPANEPPCPLHPGLQKLWVGYDWDLPVQAMSASIVRLVIHSRRAFRR